MKKRILTLLVSTTMVFTLAASQLLPACAQSSKQENVAISTPKAAYMECEGNCTLPAFVPRHYSGNTADGSSDYGYFKLNASQRKAYAVLKQAAKAKSANKKIDIKSLKLTRDQARTVFYYFTLDNPQLFWVGSGTSYYTGNTVNSMSFKSIYTDSKGNTDTAKIGSIQKSIDNTVKIYLNAVKGISGQYEKELALHDMLINNISYDENDKFGAHDENITIVGPFVDKSATSFGYSCALQYLLNRCGIECNIAYNSKSSRTWNIAKINNKYYSIDATYDDYVFSDKEFISHEYFNITSNEMLAGDKYGSNLYPEPSCTATDYNYFVRTGSYYKTTDDFENKMVNSILTSINNGSYMIQIKAPDSSTLSNITSQLYDSNYNTTTLYNQIMFDGNSKLSDYQIFNASAHFTDNNIFNLHLTRESNNIDKTVLVQKIIYAKKYYSNSAAYTGSSYSKFTAALSAAKSVNLDSSATQDQVDTAKNNLQTAINKLCAK